MQQAGIHGIVDAVCFLMPVAEAFARGYCLYRFVQPFMVSPVMSNGACSCEDVKAFRTGKKKVAACGLWPRVSLVGSDSRLF